MICFFISGIFGSLKKSGFAKLSSDFAPKNKTMTSPYLQVVGPSDQWFTIPETNSSPLKMDGWKMNFLLGFGLFSEAKC